MPHEALALVRGAAGCCLAIIVEPLLYAAVRAVAEFVCVLALSRESLSACSSRVTAVEHWVPAAAP